MSVTHGHCHTRAAIRTGKALQRNRSQGCILYERVLLDEAEKVVIDRNVNSHGHCETVWRFLMENSYEAIENTLQFSHVRHPLGFGKILGEVCVLLMISEAMKLSSSFLNTLQECIFNILYELPDLNQGCAA